MMQKWKFKLAVFGCSRQEIVDLDYLGFDEYLWSKLSIHEKGAEVSKAYSRWIIEKAGAGFEEVTNE